MRRSSKVFSLRQLNIKLRNSCLFTDEKSDFQLRFSSACISSQLRPPNDFVFGSLSFNSKLNYLMPCWYLRLRCSLCYCSSLLNIEKKISWPHLDMNIMESCKLYLSFSILWHTTVRFMVSE